MTLPLFGLPVSPLSLPPLIFFHRLVEEVLDVFPHLLLLLLGDGGGVLDAVVLVVRVDQFLADLPKPVLVYKTTVFIHSRLTSFAKRFRSSLGSFPLYLSMIALMWGKSYTSVSTRQIEQTEHQLVKHTVFSYILFCFSSG